MNRLQSVLNAAARLVFSARKYNHITPRAVIASRCQRSLAPSYLSDELRRASDVDSRRQLRSASTAVLVVPRSKHSTIGDRAFPSLWRKYGNLCRLTSHLHPHCLHSNGDWKLSFSSAVMHPTVPIYSRYCLAMHTNYWCYMTLKLFCVTLRWLPFVFTYLLSAQWMVAGDEW